MLKIIFTLLILWFNNYCIFSQNFQYNLKTSFFATMSLEDSLEYEMTHNDVVSYNFSKFYSRSYIYKLKNGKEINVHFYSDTTIYFEEYNKDRSEQLSSGELIIDSSKLSILISDIPIVDSVGDPLIDKSGNMIYPADTFYYLVPNGLWYFKIDPSKYALVNYKTGVKHGDSQIKITSNCIDDSMYVSRSYYENGNLKNSDNFELPTKKKNYELIVGQWYHPNCTYDMFLDNPVWVFQRKIPTLKPRDEMYSSNFNKNGSYDGVMYYSCGTGRSKSDYFPQYKWKIDEESSLIINDNTYEILFINEDYMFLQNKNKP